MLTIIRIIAALSVILTWRVARRKNDKRPGMDVAADGKIHIYPLNDSRIHVADGSPCWCNPVSKDVRIYDGSVVGAIVTHKAADWRANQKWRFLSGAN